MWWRRKKDKDARLKIAVLFGGRSAEHEISVLTALQAIAALDPVRYEVIPVYLHPEGKWYIGEALLDKQTYRCFTQEIHRLCEVTLLPDPTIGGLTVMRNRSVIPVDVYLLAFHGQFGEDGCIQGLLELVDACYVGCGPLSAAITMDKAACKRIVKSHGIPVLPWCVIDRVETAQQLSEVKEKILLSPGLGGFPLFVKPCNLGSSVGISAVYEESQLGLALAKVFQYDVKAMVEPCLQDLLEVNVSVLGGYPPRVSVVEIPVASEKMLTYEDKYLRSGNKAEPGAVGMASLTRIVDPEDLDDHIKEKVTEYALKAFDVLMCSGVVRFDFMMDTVTGQIYFNEPNTIPGSFAYYLWEKSHPPLLYTQLLDKLIDHAQRSKSISGAVQHHIGFKALK